MGEQTPSSIISEYINTNWITSSSAHLQIWTCECAHSRDNSIFVWPLLEEFVLQPWVPGEQNVGTTQTLTTEVYDHTFTRGIMKGEPSQEPLRWWRDSYEERWESLDCSAWTRRDMGNLINVNKYWKGECKKGGARHFAIMPSEGILGNRHKLKHRPRF